MNHDTIELNLRRGRIPYFNLRNKLEQKITIKKKLDQFNNYLNTFGLSFSKIDITPVQNNFKYKLSIFEKMSMDTIDSEEDAISQRAKDLALMSDKSYKIFRNTLGLHSNLASLRKCNKYKKKLNKLWAIRDNDVGSYVKDPIKKIQYVCQKFIEKNISKNPDFQIENNIFKVLISGDGINVTKTHLSLLNFTFSLINDGDLSFRGFYTLGIEFILKYIKINQFLY